MINMIGIIGTTMFSLCALPQAYKCYRTGRATGISAVFLWMWLGGEFLMQFYVIARHGFDYVILFNYWFNMLLIFIIMRYYYVPRVRNYRRMFKLVHLV